MDLVSCLDQRRSDSGMVNDLSKRRRRRVTTQEVEGHDMEVAAQDASVAGQNVSFEETARIDQE